MTVTMSPLAEGTEGAVEEEEGEGETQHKATPLPTLWSWRHASSVHSLACCVKKQRENPIPVALLNLTGTIDGYNKTQTEIKVAPLELGSVTQRIIVEFDEVQDKQQTRDDQGNLVTRRLEFWCR